MMDNILIELKGIEKTYGEHAAAVHALRGINVSIHKNEIVAIMGSSGSGKSTMLNIIGCMDKQSSGDYILMRKNINNANFTEMASYRNKIFGFVMQDFALIEHFSVEQNIELPLYYSMEKPSKKERKMLCRDVILKLGLEAKTNTPTKFLSGGQKQRVAIGRALINNPKIILADEPTGSLDKKTSLEIMTLLLELNKMGTTIIVVTHDPLVANLCKRIIKIEDGKIIEVSTQ